MTASAQIAFLDMCPSIGIRDAIQTRVRELSALSDRLEKCRILVEAPHRHSPRPDTLYGMRIRLTFPDDELAIEVQPQKEDVYAAIQDGFQTARCLLEDYEQRRARESAHSGRSDARQRRPRRRR